MRSWCISSNQSIVLSFEVLKQATFFSELESNVFLGISLKFKPVSIQLYICSGVKSSFFIISKNLLLNHSIWIGSGKSFSLQMPICRTACFFFQRSNYPRLTAKFWSLPTALFRDIAFFLMNGLTDKRSFFACLGKTA